MSTLQSQPRLPDMTLLIQRSDKDSSAVARDLSAASARGPLTIGSVVRLGRKSPASNARWLANSRPAPVRIADPECWTRADQHSELTQASAKWPHLIMPRGRPNTPEEKRWLVEVGQAQAQAGATVLLSPGLWTVRRGNLDHELRLAAALAGLFPEYPVLVNWALHYDWLTTPAKVKIIISRLANVPAQGVYLRAQLPTYSPSYTEPRRGRANGYLAGLSAVSAAAAESGVLLWLPNSGLTGWAMCAVGARGAGTGTSWGQRVWLKPTGARRGAGRYCEETLLHTVRADMHTALAALAGYTQCRCQHCRLLFAQTAWDYELAGRHYLGVVGRAMRGLAAQPPAGRKAWAKHLVDTAIAEQQRLEALDPVVLSGNRPQHLKLWQAILT